MQNTTDAGNKGGAHRDSATQRRPPGPRKDLHATGTRYDRGLREPPHEHPRARAPRREGPTPPTTASEHNPGSTAQPGSAAREAQAIHLHAKTNREAPGKRAAPTRKAPAGANPRTTQRLARNGRPLRQGFTRTATKPSASTQSPERGASPPPRKTSTLQQRRTASAAPPESPTGTHASRPLVLHLQVVASLPLLLPQ